MHRLTAMKYLNNNSKGSYRFECLVVFFVVKSTKLSSLLARYILYQLLESMKILLDECVHV